MFRKKIYRPENIVSYELRCDLSGSSWYPAQIKMQHVLYPSSSSNCQLLKKCLDYSKLVTIIQDDPNSLENCFDTFGPPTAAYYLPFQFL